MSRSLIVNRIGYGALGLCLLVFAPWWAFAAWTLLGIVIFQWYIEGVALSLMADMLYGVFLWLPGIPFLFFISALLALWCGEWIKAHVVRR